MNSLNGLVNLAMLGVLLFCPNRLRGVMVTNLTWVLLQFVWIAVRPQDWLARPPGSHSVGLSPATSGSTTC